ncbi:MAG: YraN family protein [Dysgonamonadaceae bacterium]|jgi:putative endonuclease|nr:YraN family protein [Dysgonamonadaceae bacterium]
MANHNTLGKDGEEAAIKYLLESGYQVLHINWRKGRYELDIVAKTDEELVVVEVKTRSGSDWMNPEDAVDTGKIRNIVIATDIYIKIFNIDLPARFDIISVIGSYPNFEINHIEDAFFPPLNTYK